MPFTGKASYHSDQVPHIHAAFTPDAAAIRDAEAILAAARQDATGLTRVDGRIVNAAIVKIASVRPNMSATAPAISAPTA